MQIGFDCSAWNLMHDIGAELGAELAIHVFLGFAMCCNIFTLHSLTVRVDNEFEDGVDSTESMGCTASTQHHNGFIFPDFITCASFK